MNERIVPAVLTFLGLIVGPVVSHLITKPMDVWTTAVWFESLFHLRRHKLCSLLLGIGLSYSVPFTMILESVFLGEELRPVQWIGGMLFGLAFAAIYRDMREAHLLTPAREQVRRGASGV